MRPFHLIVACAENRVIGRAGRLPWSIPEDRAYFERMTDGGILILGRVCFERWPGAAAGGRRAIAVTSRPADALAQKPAATAASFAAALERANALSGEIFVCGGQRIYEEAIIHPAAQWLHLTLVHATVEGDRTFPDWRKEFPREAERRESADGSWRYTFLTLTR